MKAQILVTVTHILYDKIPSSAHNSGLNCQDNFSFHTVFAQATGLCIVPDISPAASFCPFFVPFLLPRVPFALLPLDREILIKSS